ncbi:LemA family protein [Derxia lacustris]|uniref:LemA family protein n=1 Tax=Derxia lacustris TaxID=764842 RepID=UPI000A177815|nr:LemA family protein [Derxia lacustris]
MVSRLWLVLALFTAVLLGGCGYNDIQRQDQAVKAAWAEVLNQYQRRADLIPNIVATVKGEANFEQETLTQIADARASVGRMNVSPETLNDPAAFDRFQKAQGQLGGALSRLLAVSENYPNLKANAAFQDLRAQLEGAENRIAIARKRYIDTVAQYNTTLALLQNKLGAMLAGAKEKPQFTVADEAAVSKPPTVDFGGRK